MKRPGEDKVKCTIMLLLDYQPAQYKLDPRLARLLGIHTQTRPVIINALWQYIKVTQIKYTFQWTAWDWKTCRLPDVPTAVQEVTQLIILEFWRKEISFPKSAPEPEDI